MASTKQYHSATTLLDLNRLRETLLLREGFAYFESWYEGLAKDGVDTDSSTQSEFLAWQVK